MMLSIDKKRFTGRLLYFFTGILILALAVFLIFMFRFRGNVKVSPDRDIIVSKDCMLYRQDDRLWAEDCLGDSHFTMGSSGCLVTCIASAVNVDPKTLNEIFSQHHVYDSEGNLLWGNIKNVDDDYHVEVFSNVSEDILMDCLDHGRFPIVRVRMHGIGNFHYVLIVKAENGVFYCMDPLQDGIVSLAAYGNRVYAIRCVY